MKVFKYDPPMAVKTAPTTSVAREAQRLFFEIGMVQRTRIGAAFTELGLTFAPFSVWDALTRFRVWDTRVGRRVVRYPDGTVGALTDSE